MRVVYQLQRLNIVEIGENLIIRKHVYGLVLISVKWNGRVCSDKGGL
jgi:hypothetical protein